MEVIKLKYNIDYQRTEEFYKNKAFCCSCIVCNNFRKVLPIYHPEIIEILSSFGLLYDHEFEFISYSGLTEENFSDHILYEALYAVFGTLDEDNLVIYEKDDIKITLLKKESSGGLVPSTNEDFFMLNVWITLPYEL